MKVISKLVFWGGFLSVVHAVSDWETDEYEDDVALGTNRQPEHSVVDAGYKSVAPPAVDRHALNPIQGYHAIQPPTAYDVKNGETHPETPRMPPTVTLTVVETETRFVTERCHPVTITVTSSKKKCRKTPQPVPTFYSPDELLKPSSPCGNRPCGDNPYLRPSNPCPGGQCHRPMTSTIKSPVQTPGCSGGSCQKPPSNGCQGGSCPRTSTAKQPVYTPTPSNCSGGSCQKPPSNGCQGGSCPRTSTAKQPVYTPTPSCSGGSCQKPTTSTVEAPVYTPSPSCSGGSCTKPTTTSSVKSPVQTPACQGTSCQKPPTSGCQGGKCPSHSDVKSTQQRAHQEELEYRNNMDFSNKYDSDDTGYYAYLPPPY